MNLQSFLKTPLMKQASQYALFCAIMWIIHLIIISVVTYFHLLLDHNIRTIGDWIVDRGWTLIIVSKVSTFYLFFLFVNLRNKKIISLKSYFRNNTQLPRNELAVIVIFLLIAVVGIFNVSYNSSMIFEIDRFLLTLVGTMIFFAVDYLFLIVMDVFYPFYKEQLRTRRILIFSLIFYFFTKITFVYEQTIGFHLFALFVLLLYLGEWRRKNWTYPMLFLFFFITPFYLLLGFDPVWSDTYSFFRPTKEFEVWSFIIIVLIAIIYLLYQKIQKPEYIYRD